MLYGVLLVYYEEYHLAAVSELKIFLNRIDSNNKLIVVTNNPRLKSSYDEYILGEDLRSEFSGYDVGIKQIGNLSLGDYVVFANDTFCHHRHWGYFEKRIFTNSFRDFMANKIPGLVGEVNSFGKIFSLMKLQASNWVSTYLFCTSSDFLWALDCKLYLDEEVLSHLVSSDSSGRLKWGDDISDNIKIQLSNWLSISNKHGWHNKNATISQKIIKVYAILNEFYISAFAKNNGFVVADVYRNLALLDRITLKRIRLTKYIKSYFGWHDAP